MERSASCCSVQVWPLRCASIFAFSLAPYFGNGLDGKDADIVDQATEAIANRLGQVQRVEQTVKEAGLRLVTYEGGQHLKENSDVFCVNPATGRSE